MNRWTSALVVAIIVLVAGGALAIGLSGSHSAANRCTANGTPVKYTVSVQDGKVSETDLHAKLCDTLTITNKDNIARTIAFGVHDKHVVYDGISERVLAEDKSLTVTLDKAGKYHWHDHLHDEVEGYFTVTE